ncbi:MAG: hypothetical protein EXS35_10095 [Pedosphaera sp.]|nr:hypothetical protein [Pedosphaera sp.]
MKGIRAFGENEGGLNHCGDFALLFSPLLPQLADVAAFHPNVTFSEFYAVGAPDNFEEIVNGLSEELAQLDLRSPEEKRKRVEPYYRPGFFPKFASYVEDDWNEILCFKPPFPEYPRIFNIAFSEEARSRNYSALRKLYRSLQFFAYFRNIDACWWEFYAPHDELIAAVQQHLAAHRLEYEELDFEVDYPFGGLKKKRRFAGVHSIWPPESN